MAIRKVVGIETEYGITHRGMPDANPVSSSSTLVNAYVAALRGRVGWDFEDETPGNDARGFAIEGSLPPEIESHLVNAVLTNGARYYVDHAHPEVSVPECADAREVVVWDRAGEEIVRASMRAAAAFLPEGQELVAYKNNSDGKGNSYGCHENYLLDRSVPFARIVEGVTPFFASRQIFCGAGKVGVEIPGYSATDVPFQLSQRADFIEESVGLETTLKRPIVNTRDEPHADHEKYRRLHVIIGDANLSEIATYLKVGTTSIVLAMIEDDEVPEGVALATPVSAVRAISHDPSLATTVERFGGGRISALDLQWAYLTAANKYAETHGLESVGDEVGRDVLRRWEAVLTGLESDPQTLADQLDWVAKLQVLDGFRARDGLGWGSARLRAVDLQYHDLRPERSLFTRLPMQRLTSDAEVMAAMTEPPRSTRAYFRGQCLARWPDQIVAANWDSLVFDVGGEPLLRVPMMEPLRGSAEHVEALLAACATPAELLERLGARSDKGGDTDG